MLLNELGEFGLIERISRLLPAQPEDVVVGIGDDVAVLRVSGPKYLLATCDIQVENIHFLRSATTPYQLGRKVIAVNMSDIASMGGEPKWALASLALPPETPVDFVDELYRGMGEEISRTGAAIVGGNVSRATEGVVIDLFLMGEIAPELLVLRSGAREGDLVLVTGAPGDSRAGFELISHPHLAVSFESSRRVLEKHLTPTPRLREGKLLAGSGCVHAMCDVSDGIAGDLRHICRASGKGAEIVAADLPVSPACAEVALAAGRNARDWILTGGEDYELLFTTAPEDALRLRAMLRDELGTPCHTIGRVLSEEAGLHVLFPDGTRLAFDAMERGWDHFGAA